MKRMLFFNAYRQKRELCKFKLSYWHINDFTDDWILQENDYNWLVEDLKLATDEDLIRILFRAILHIYRMNRNDQERLLQLQSLSQKSLHLKTELDSFLNPPAVEQSDWKKKHMEFKDVVEHLKGKSKRILANNHKIRDLYVFPVDFTTAN